MEGGSASDVHGLEQLGSIGSKQAHGHLLKIDALFSFCEMYLQ